MRASISFVQRLSNIVQPLLRSATNPQTQPGADSHLSRFVSHFVTLRATSTTTMAVSLLAPFSLLYYFYTLPDLTFLYSAANKYYHHSSFPLSIAFSSLSGSLPFSLVFFRFQSFVCDLRSENMRDRLQESLSAHRNELVSLLSRFLSLSLSLSLCALKLIMKLMAWLRNLGFGIAF